MNNLNLKDLEKLLQLVEELKKISSVEDLQSVDPSSILKTLTDLSNTDLVKKNPGIKILLDSRLKELQESLKNIKK